MSLIDNHDLAASWERFATALEREAKDGEDYARNTVRANGEDETEMSRRLNDAASILRSVAKAAREAGGGQVTGDTTMSNETPKDGGPAFPHLRDYLAAHALAGILASAGGGNGGLMLPPDDDLTSEQVTARYAYEWADAMLAARSAPPPPPPASKPSDDDEVGF